MSTTTTYILEDNPQTGDYELLDKSLNDPDFSFHGVMCSGALQEYADLDCFPPRIKVTLSIHPMERSRVLNLRRTIWGEWYHGSWRIIYCQAFHLLDKFFGITDDNWEEKGKVCTWGLSSKPESRLFKLHILIEEVSDDDLNYPNESIIV